jgi:peroxiredoxin (alkyl hydroperoxide reductase subunit C)
MYESIQPIHAPIVGRSLPDLEYDVFVDDKIIKGNFVDYRGRWLILFFYPGDFTFVCPTELKEIAGLYKEFKALNAEVAAVSCDTVFSHKAWHDSSPAIKTVTYPMIADPSGLISKTLGVYLEKEGVSLRGTFIVDPEGIIKSAEVNDNSIGRSAAELLRKLQAAKYVAEHKGEVCPASWKPGSDTLRPGADLVGKI